MLDDHSLIAARFRQLADRFTKIAAATPALAGRVALDQAKPITDAGQLVISAFHRGYFQDIPGLAKLVAWVGNSPPLPSSPLPGKWIEDACPANLFIELCGNHQILAKRDENGQWYFAADATRGGILPAMAGDLLPGLPVEGIER